MPGILSLTVGKHYRHQIYAPDTVANQWNGRSSIGRQCTGEFVDKSAARNQMFNVCIFCIGCVNCARRVDEKYILSSSNVMSAPVHPDGEGTGRTQLRLVSDNSLSDNRHTRFPKGISWPTPRTLHFAKAEHCRARTSASA